MADSTVRTDAAPASPDGSGFDALLNEGRLAEAEELALRRIGQKRWHEEALTTLARCALARGRPDDAVRWADRNCRLSPASLSLACFLGALHLARGDSAAALQALARFDDETLSTDAAVTRGHALIRDGRVGDALELAVATASGCLVGRDSVLAVLLDRATRLAGRIGWAAAGLDADTDTDGGERGIRLIGTLHLSPGAASASAPAVRLACGGVTLFELPVAGFAERYGRAGLSAGLGFSVPLPAEAADRSLALSCGGEPLAGPARAPAVLALEGDAAVADDLLSGWAWLPALPERRLTIAVTDATGRRVTVPADRLNTSLRGANIGDGHYGFALDLPASGLRPGRLRVHPLADALPLRGESLTGAPVLWIDTAAAVADLHRIARALPSGAGGEASPLPALAAPLAASAYLRRLPVAVPSAPPERPPGTPQRAARTDIVIPVYRGRAETLACIASVLDSVGTEVEIIVIDDASPDPALSRDLEGLAGRGVVTLLVNPQNLGFPATVNRGLALHPGRDVVLLNSDTLVSGDWLNRLRDAAYAGHDTGTVTPLSNDADILSYPSGNRQTADAAATARLHGLARRCNDQVRVEVPTAIGFCTFIRHDCLAETGPLDDELFGRGYGEENDFCLRARRLGWRHVAAADVFVAHVGGRSFGRRKALLAETNLRALNRLHPGYDALIRRFHGDDPLTPARRRLDMALWRETADRRPATLLITFARTGGVAHFVDQRIRDLTAQGRRVIVLRAVEADAGGERRCRVEDPRQPHLQDLLFHTARELDLLADFLRRLPLGSVELQHHLDHDPAILDLPSRLGRPFDVYVHDYCWICPRVTLIDASDRYCGEPDLAACERCARQEPAALDESLTVAGLRARSAAVLEQAERVVLPSRDVARRIARHAPRATLTVQPWEDIAPAPIPAPPSRQPRNGRRWRVCLIGAIGNHKGYDVLLDCARDAARRDLPLEFVVVGYSRADLPLFETGRVFVTGPFLTREAEDLARRQDADLAFLPSVCPETWSYALSHAWAAGLTAVAFDIGTIAERIRAAGGHLLPFGLSPDTINDRLIALMAGTADAPPHDKGPAPMPSFPATTAPAQTRLAASAQTLTFHPGLYSVTVVRGDAAPKPEGLALPSVHLAPLPATADQVETLSAAGGGWLFRTGDAVVIKVSQAPAHLVLTSYQEEGSGQSLGVQIARLGAGAAEPAQLQAPAPVQAPIQAQVPAPVPAPNAVAAVKRTRAVVRTHLMAHVQNHGDLVAPDGGWAGLPEQGVSIEAFAITLLDGAPTDGIEYKGLTANGVETPWVPGGRLCGSRGTGVPLTGLAIRLKGPLAERFECLYEISFLSGARSPALSDGQPYRSDAVGDPIQAFALRIIERQAALAAPSFA